MTSDQLPHISNRFFSNIKVWKWIITNVGIRPEYIGSYYHHMYQAKKFYFWRKLGAI